MESEINRQRCLSLPAPREQDRQAGVREQDLVVIADQRGRRLALGGDELV
jgi:hypothetical protein